MERVMVFMDGSNIYHGLKAHNSAHGRDMGSGVRIDYERLVEVLLVGRQLRRAYFYGSYTHEGDPSWSFFETLRYGIFKVRAFPLRSVAQTYVEKGVDMNITLDLTLHAARQHLDTAILVSGSSDYLPLMEAAQDLGIRVEVAAFRESTSPRLIKEADLYVNIEEIVQEVRISGREHEAHTQAERADYAEDYPQDDDAY